jgi:PGAP1-like protein
MATRQQPPSPLKHLRASDLRSVAQLATQATLGVAAVVEGVHQSVWKTLGSPDGAQPGRARGLTGLVYRSVRGITHGVGKGVDVLLAGLQPTLERISPAGEDTPERDAVLAALNGVVGDRLTGSHNPLATPMSFRGADGRSFDPSAQSGATGKILLLVHGLCMNDRQWQFPDEATGQDSGHGAVLAAGLGYTPVYLRYNTGLHTSQNGHALATQLEALVVQWPVPVTELSVLAHSMGGLVMRSAVQVAQSGRLRWPSKLKHIVFLGTPHHGAPLERAGHWLDLILGSTPWTAPLARLGQLRSAGITDLRHGHVRDEDWQDHGRFEHRHDVRHHLPLPAGVACHAIAATTGQQPSAVGDRLVGDGLVPVASALGHHPDPTLSLAFGSADTHIFHGMNHMELMHSPAVTQKVAQWLAPTPAA